ncbi:hypothetical protein GWK47_040007 [Chionoecetes opilio]|uniref:Uncharacterized protein n=1 Tax=Chionoecetes opilio TaxID=41210 RepID=A0A8J4YB27_CHIOP|nr:hypothetical protein GWK47_040007 [Chionoecetes opilio]
MRDAIWGLFLSSSEDLFNDELHTLPSDAQADRLSTIILQAAHLLIPISKPHARLYKDRWFYCPGSRKSTAVLMPLTNSSVATLPLPPAPISKALLAMHRQSRPASATRLSPAGARVSLRTHPSDVCGDAFGPYSTPLVLPPLPTHPAPAEEAERLVELFAARTSPPILQPLFLLRPSMYNNFLLVPALPPFTLHALKNQNLTPPSPRMS